MGRYIIETVCQSGLCTGCGLCSSIFPNKVKMINSINGYFRPVQLLELNNNESKLFRKLCPGISVRNVDILKNYHHIWGKILKFYYGYATDKYVRFKGSSGGGLSALLIYLIESKKVDYIINTSSSLENPLYNLTRLSETKLDIIESSGSRYSPSSPLENINYYLSKEGKFAFVGKPCDIYALRQYSKYNRNVNNKVLYYISFFCAGVPSINGSREILSKFGIKEERLKSIRYRGEGWPGKAKLYTNDNKIYEIDYIESWSKILGKYLQFRCKICPDGIGEFADIVFGDAWHTKDGHPIFEEDGGQNIIIARTEIGLTILNEAIINNYIHVKNLDYNINMISNIQPYHEKRKKMLLSRLIALRILFKRYPIYKNIGILKASETNIITIIKSILGMIKRIILSNECK